MVNVLFWVAFGSVIGWIATILQNENAPRRIAGFVIAGALGGLGGGFGGLLLSPSGLDGKATSTDIIFALFGATAFVMIASLADQSRSRE